MANAARTLDPIKALNESLPANERVKAGERMEEQARMINAAIDAINTTIDDINSAGVTGLSIPTTVKIPVSQKVTLPSEL